MLMHRRISAKIVAKLESLPSRKEASKQNTQMPPQSFAANLVLELLPLIEKKHDDGYTFKEIAEIICKELPFKMNPATILYYMSSYRSKLRRSNVIVQEQTEKAR